MSGNRLGWLDLSCGVSGDMLLGALVGAGVELATITDAVGALGLPVTITATTVDRGGIAATKIDVHASADGTVRTWSSIRDLLGAAAVPDGVRRRSLAVFHALAAAEATVHGVGLDDVHFHEVGALDALADVVGACAGFEALGLTRLIASPVALGGGHVRTAHGVLPVPGPAVLELLRVAGATALGGPVDVELCTPTGAALVATWVDGYGAMPPLVPGAVGLGAGGRDLPDRPNVVRLVVGTPASTAGPGGSGPGTAVLLETNVDDLDPRAWPGILAVLIAGGASDAWLTPILMKKGRPAHTLSVLVSPERIDAVRSLVFTETPTLGLRQTTVGKHELARRFVTVTIDGQDVAVKVAALPDGTVTNVQPEWADVVRAADILGRPVRRVLAESTAAGLTAYHSTHELQTTGNTPNEAHKHRKRTEAAKPHTASDHGGQS